MKKNLIRHRFYIVFLQNGTGFGKRLSRRTWWLSSVMRACILLIEAFCSTTSATFSFLPITSGSLFRQITFLFSFPFPYSFLSSAWKKAPCRKQKYPLPVKAWSPDRQKLWKEKKICQSLFLEDTEGGKKKPARYVWQWKMGNTGRTDMKRQQVLHILSFFFYMIRIIQKEYFFWFHINKNAIPAYHQIAAVQQIFLQGP